MLNHRKLHGCHHAGEVDALSIAMHFSVWMKIDKFHDPRLNAINNSAKYYCNSNSFHTDKLQRITNTMKVLLY